MNGATLLVILNKIKVYIYIYIYISQPVCLHLCNMTLGANDVLMFLEGGVILKNSETGGCILISGIICKIISFC